MPNKYFACCILLTLLAASIVGKGKESVSMYEYADSIEAGFQGSIFIVDKSFRNVSDKIEQQLNIKRTQKIHNSIYSISPNSPNPILKEDKTKVSFAQMASRYQ